MPSGERQALAVGSTAQLADALYPNKQTLDPPSLQLYRPTYMPQRAVLWLSPPQYSPAAIHYL